MREQAVLRLLQEKGSVRARDLVNRFNVTAMTVWRDLRRMEEQGLVRSFHGGVSLVRPDAEEADFETKARLARRAKDAIAAHVASKWIRNGMTLALEGGTTVSSVLTHVSAKDLSVITNSLPVASHVRENRSEIPVWLPCGTLSPVSGNLCGADAVRAIRRRRADLAIISATGFMEERGLLDPNPLEIEAKRALCESASKTLVLLDSSKFGRDSAFPVLPLRRIAALVTEKDPVRKHLDWLAREGVAVEIAPLSILPHES